jgi:hypothetical protein
MIPDELDVVLNEYFTEELRRAPARHHQQTDDCPSLLRFPTSVRNGWSPKDRRHVTCCDFCQKVTAMQWRMECPSLASLVRNSLREAPDAAAMAIHIKEDGCARCRSIFEAVSRGAAALAAARELALESLGALTPDSLLGLGRWAVKGECGPITLAKPQLYQRSADGSLDANLWLDWNELLLSVRSELAASCRESWGVRAAVVFEESDPLIAEFDLEDKGSLGHISQHSFGRYDEKLARRMDRPFALVVEWSD